MIVWLVIVGVIPTLIASFLAWQLTKVRAALAVALESLVVSRMDLDAMKAQINVLLTRFSDVREQWEHDRAQLVTANHELMKTNRNALDVIRAALARQGDVPPHLTGELLHAVVGDK